MAHARYNNGYTAPAENRRQPHGHSHAGGHQDSLPYPPKRPQQAQKSGDWNSLRGELENLLDQVHMHQHDKNFEMPHQNNAPAYPSSYRDPMMSRPYATERFNEQEEAYSMPAQSQHQLQNAIRQIRTSQRGQSPLTQSSKSQNTRSQDTRGRAPMRANIQRGSQPQYQQEENFAPGHGDSHRGDSHRDAQFDGFSHALADIGTRLESFEHSISKQHNSEQAIADMAMQVEQLSGVVEHLANNIGERGHIKRLETQITKLADAMPEEQGLDFQSLNQRLDVLSGAFEQLRDLQAQQVELNIKYKDDGDHMGAIETSVKNIYDRLDGMGLDRLDLEPVETCVRTVYDRIDALEHSMAMPTPTIERLSREMADFTQAMRNTGTEEGSATSTDLITRVDALIARIEQIEIEGQPVGELKIDMQELHTTLTGAMEPRFAAIETQIGTISGQLARQFDARNAEANVAPNTSVQALEKHIHALATKMDKTSSELNGLHQMFEQKGEASPAPNINDIAELVAERTTQAMKMVRVQPGKGVEQQALDALETRLSGLFKEHSEQRKNKDGTSSPQKSLQEFVGVQNSINQVNQRLARLETTLSAQHATSTDEQESEYGTLKSASTGQSDQATSGRRRAAPKRTRHPGLSQDNRNNLEFGTNQAEAKNNEGREPARHLIPELRDNMPRPPAQDAPLNAAAFDPPKADLSAQQISIPIPDSLRVDPNDLEVVESEVLDIDATLSTNHGLNSQNKSSEVENPIRLPEFDANNVTPPPAPVSSFGNRDVSNNPKNNFANKQEPINTEAGEAQVSRSTFIEAARRAAMAKNADVEQQEPLSLIGRAMARFQNKRDAAREAKADNAVDEVSNENIKGAQRVFPGDESITPDTKTTPPKHITAEDEFELDDLTTVPESFLTRHRQPILLVAAIVAVSLLTLNFINQRNSDVVSAGSSAIVSNQTGATNTNADGNGAKASSETPSQAGAANTNSAQPMRDSSVSGDDIVGSIDRFSGVDGSNVRVIAPDDNSQMPAALSNASLSLSAHTNSAIDLELPPAALGPQLLREAASDGDPRAQFEVAAIFAEGRAIAQDLVASAKWYERAAAQGYAPAGYRLANMYENGVGVEKDLSSARLWYQLAADAGNRMSMHNLASLLAGGQLGEQQFESAAHWFEKAADLGLKDSQFNLGMLHARGLGVPQNLETSYKWFSIAANGGDEDAAKARDDIASSLDPQIVAGLNNGLTGWTPSEMNIRANFAPIGTWSPDFDPGPVIDSREVVQRVQAALNGLGFDTGIPDGLIGPKTIEAIKGFETQAGMSTSGAVNPRLLAVLGSQPV